MGRLKIKNKDAVLPFRQTAAYRFVIIVVMLIAFVYSTIWAISSYQEANASMIAIIIAITLAVSAVVGIFYNLDKMRYARVPKKTAMRMKRR